MIRGPGRQVDELQAKRIDLLTERVAELKELHEEARCDAITVTRAEVDLMEAKLEYASSNAEKRDLLRELLGKHDQRRP